MTKRLIKYICFFDTEDNVSEKRNQSPAAHQKICSILSLLSNLDIDIEIISASQTLSEKSFNEKETFISSNIKLRLFKTYGRSGLISRIKRMMFGYRDFKKYIKKTIKKGDTVLLYHSLEYLNFFINLKKKVNFKLILEMEELYSDIKLLPRADKRHELCLANISDALILPTYTMNMLVNRKNKPYIVLHGDYRPKVVNRRQNNDRVKVVYSGTFDLKKGGVVNAINCSTYLPKNFDLFIMGFGNKEEINFVTAKCAEKQKETSCSIKYLGCLTNSQCEQFLEECDIGLCTQDASGNYNTSSFPSKILTYLKNGMKVVSCKNETICKSDVSDLLFFYEGNDPQKIASAIKNAANSRNDRVNQFDRLNFLYTKSLENINSLLNAIDGERKL